MSGEPHRYRRTAAAVAVVTGIIEAVSIFLRFGLDIVASRDTQSTVAPLTGNLRIHHGYIGIVLLLLAWFLFKLYPKTARGLGILGAALVLSDLIHHLLVLWPLTGSPELHFFYPNSPLN